MLGRKKRLLENTSFLIDVLAGIIVMGGVYFFLLHFGEEWEQFLTSITGYPFDIQTVTHLGDQGWLFSVILLNLFASLKMNRFYQLDLFAKWHEVFFQSLKCILIGTAMTALFFYFFSIIRVNRSLLFGFTGLFFIYHFFKELFFRRYLLQKHYRRNPFEALLVCSAESAADWVKDFSRPQFSSVSIKGVALTGGEKDDLAASLRQKVVGKSASLAHILSHGRYDFVFLGLPQKEMDKAQIILRTAEEQGIEVWYFADILNPVLSRPEIDEYGGKPVIVFKTTPHYEGKLLAKRLFDIVVSSALLLLSSPLFLIVAALIKGTSRGSVIYGQVRTGWRGKPFRMYKFRTMKKGAEAERDALLELNEMKGPVFKSGEDPRVTAMGSFLRRYSLDELPQLLNVLKGEMSLVGPRPLPLYETENFEAFKDHRRYSVLPGLTGLWQVSGRNEIEDFSEWVRLDLEYIDKWSMWLDIVILFRTIPVVLNGFGAK